MLKTQLCKRDMCLPLAPEILPALLTRAEGIKVHHKTGELPNNKRKGLPLGGKVLAPAKLSLWSHVNFYGSIYFSDEPMRSRVPLQAATLETAAHNIYCRIENF